MTFNRCQVMVVVPQGGAGGPPAPAGCEVQYSFTDQQSKHSMAFSSSLFSFSMIFLQSTAWLHFWEKVRAANPPKGFGLFACASCPAYSELFTEAVRRCGRSLFEGMGASDASDPEEPLFAIQHSGNRRVARNSVFPSSFAMWVVNWLTKRDRLLPAPAVVVSFTLCLCNWRCRVWTVKPSCCLKDSDRSNPIVMLVRNMSIFCSVNEVIFGESRFAPLLAALGDLPNRWQASNVRIALCENDTSLCDHLAVDVPDTAGKRWRRSGDSCTVCTRRTLWCC